MTELKPSPNSPIKSRMTLLSMLLKTVGSQSTHPFSVTLFLGSVLYSGVASFPPCPENAFTVPVLCFFITYFAPPSLFLILLFVETLPTV